MGFASGGIAYARFAVIGPNQKSSVDTELLGKLEAHAFKRSELGTPEPVEYGWSGGRHIEDGHFGFETNVFNDCLLFALRVDTNKVPGEVVKAYRLQEEAAVAKDNPSGFISKAQKSQVKQSVQKRVEEELRTGKYRRTRLIPILWDLPSSRVYFKAGSADQDKIFEIFERSFGLALSPKGSAGMALDALEPAGLRREFEDFKATRFVQGPGGESQWPDYPWVMKCPDPKEFLGNEFLLWLWYEADGRTGVIACPGGDLTVMFDKSVELDCAYGETGRDTLRAVGPTKMPEALKALRFGKVPRKVGLVMDYQGSQYTFTVSDRFVFTGLQLPEIKDADTPRTLFEERITALRAFEGAWDDLYGKFLKLRTAGWDTTWNAIANWIVKAN